MTSEPTNSSDLPPHAAEGGWRFDHSYARLPEVFHAKVGPTAVSSPGLVIFNRKLAADLGLDADALSKPEPAPIFAGNRLPPGASPLAQAYAGHQFGNFTMLGDGRAVLLGEQITPDGRRFDVQLKGPGRTPYSRRGDGRAALGPMLREYIISEAMHAMGIPTTRSLAVASTGEPVYRETVLPGAVLTRIAASHIRVGTFEWAAACGQPGAIAAIADYTLQRHYPDLVGSEQPYLALLRAVVDRQAALIARWQLVGFIHGVMNTDNMALSGETIDYGPCAFMDAYNPATVFSSIDHNGRYAYRNQPGIANWNLARLAEAMLPLLHPEEDKSIELAETELRRFADRFETAWLSGMRAKLGLFTEEAEDAGLIDALLSCLHEHSADYTNSFRDLTSGTFTDNTLAQAPDFQAWQVRWKERLARQPQSIELARERMRQNNPAFIPRNHKVEEALAAANQNDLCVLHRLLEIVSDPYDHDRKEPGFSTPAGPNAQPYQTFCGT
ncbi:MAG TPA: YdiU family protein [Roseimicrobium sp.]|nr:YdiU family protein [Roseimicrobium sp.]